MIGREKEIKKLRNAYEEKRSMFVVVYGRRRIGKTYMVNETFRDEFTFTCSGLANATKPEQLLNFQASLRNAGYEGTLRLKTWFDAFEALAQFIKSRPKGKKVIFIDELPWMDTPKSRFITAFEHFWNGFASLRDDVLLIACGSATSWMIDKVINNHGGLYNRVSESIYLRPFTLRECDELVKSRGIVFSRRDIIKTYMVLGGVPFYWTLLKKGLSGAQNIDELCFTRGGQLVNECERLYASLYRNPGPYVAIMEALVKKRKGLTRTEIADTIKKAAGGKLTKYLTELEECDFVRKYRDYDRKAKGAIYQIIDPFVLFYSEFMKGHTVHDGPFWARLQNSTQYNAWARLAFERVCLLHVPQIKDALSIGAILSTVQSWHSDPKITPKRKGAQIDMLIDRADDVINVCEMKFCMGKYSLTAKDEESMVNKVETFKSATHTKKAAHLTLITVEGIAHNMYSGMVQAEVTAEELFR